MDEKNNSFIVNNCKNKDFEKSAIEYLKSKKESIFLSLGVVDDYDKFDINIFDKPEDLLSHFGMSEFPYKLGDSSAFFGSNGVTCYFDFSKNEKFDTYKRIICHEYVHSVYSNFVQEKSNDSRVVWFDEGLAQYLSGEKDYLEGDEFNEWFLKKIITKEKIIPPIEYLYQHGNKYGNFVDQETYKYNGYDLSYMAIRYLFETKSLDELQSIMRNKDKIMEIGKTILQDSIEYYKNNMTKNSKLTIK